MKKLEYLKLAIGLKLFTKMGWMISVFSVTKPHDGEKYHGKIVPQDWGYSYVDVSGELVKIEDAPKGEPIFRFLDKIMVDASWAENVDKPQETRIGNLIFNHVAILSSFGKKHPFPFGKVTISGLEDSIAPKLKSTPKEGEERSDMYYYVDELMLFKNSLRYYSGITQLSTWSATARTMTSAPGVDEFKAGLIKKYGDTLTDPVQLTHFEKELQDFDEKYLEEDPANNTFMRGKVKNVSRKKMFLTMGAGLSFTDTNRVTPITNSLQNGWPTEPEQFAAMMNDLRAGSYSRGAETIKGGVAAKVLLRSTNTLQIKDTDCGAKLGIRRVYDKSNLNKLVGRYIVGTKPVLVENVEQAGEYLGKSIKVRSPMYCKLQGDGNSRCRICCGENLFKFPDGFAIPATEVSGILLYASMKAMHGTVLSTAKLNLAASLT
jgi:hypothetical protein